MIIKATAKEIEALASLRHNPHFEAVIEWLEASYMETLSKCSEELNIESLRQQQGAAIDLREFLQHAHNARDYIEKSKR